MQKGKKEKTNDSDIKKRKKMVLGRGLDALLPDLDSLENQSNEFFHCDIELIQPNRYQPRRRFSPEELAALCDSIKAQGIIQPLLVRSNASAGYELVAGERRLRAAKMAGLTQVPVVIKTISDTAMLEISIIENIQRANLNPLEEADAYQRLIDEFKLTQEEIAQRVGKSRPAVANFLRLRQLSEQIKESIREGALSMGHARALLGADTVAQQRSAYRDILAKGMSVRQTEALIKRLKAAPKKAPPPAADQTDRHLADISDELSRHFGTRVQIKRHGRKGKVEIEFYSHEDLDSLINRLNRA